MSESKPGVFKWHRSTRSGANGNCVEVAGNIETVVAVRDSKDRLGPVLRFAPEAWAAFTASVKDREIAA